MICNRCGVVNRPGRVACVQCMARLDPASATGEALVCKYHPSSPASGRCLACGDLVCDSCGGIINNRAVYCVNDAAAAMAGAFSGAPAPKGKTQPAPAPAPAPDAGTPAPAAAAPAKRTWFKKSS